MGMNIFSMSGHVKQKSLDIESFPNYIARMKTIQDVIDKAGGVAAVVVQAQERGNRIGIWAPLKWPERGIPPRHWPMLKELTGISETKLRRLYEQARANGGGE